MSILKPIFKTLIQIIAGVFVGYISVYIITFIIATEKARYMFTTPKEGDVWRWRTDGGSEDPFKNNTLKPYYDFKVIAVKGSYVQYMDLSDSSIQSSSIRWFKIGSERISN